MSNGRASGMMMLGLCAVLSAVGTAEEIPALLGGKLLERSVDPRAFGTQDQSGTATELISDQLRDFGLHRKDVFDGPVPAL